MNKQGIIMCAVFPKPAIIKLSLKLYYSKSSLEHTRIWIHLPVHYRYGNILYCTSTNWLLYLSRWLAAKAASQEELISSNIGQTHTCH